MSTHPAIDEYEIPLTLGIGGPIIGAATVPGDGTVTATVADPAVTAALSTPMRAYSIGTTSGDVPVRERLVHDDPEFAAQIRAQIRKVVADAHAGHTVDLGSFAQHLGDEED